MTHLESHRRFSLYPSQHSCTEACGDECLLRILGLTEGFRPDGPIHGYLMYLEDLPVLHLMEWNVIAEAQKNEKGYLDRVTFSRDGLEHFLYKLEILGGEYTRRYFRLSGGVYTHLK